MSLSDRTNALFGIKEICGYLRCSKPKFYCLIEMGLPVAYRNGRLYAHKENIEKFFKELTDETLNEIPKDVE